MRAQYAAWASFTSGLSVIVCWSYPLWLVIWASRDWIFRLLAGRLALWAASSGLSSLYHWWILWTEPRPPVLAGGVTIFAGLLLLRWHTSHKTVQLLCSLLILAMMACGTLALLVWQDREVQRLKAIPRLGLDRATTWEQVVYHLDCELVTLGMDRHQVEANLALFSDYSLNDQMKSDGNGRIIVGFGEFSLKPRYYSFKDGLLSAKKVPRGLDGPRTVDCSSP
jgi:hypothetical protein